MRQGNHIFNAECRLICIVLNDSNVRQRFLKELILNVLYYHKSIIKHNNKYIYIHGLSLKASGA